MYSWPGSVPPMLAPSRSYSCPVKVPGLRCPAMWVARDSLVAFLDSCHAVPLASADASSTPHQEVMLRHACFLGTYVSLLLHTWEIDCFPLGTSWLCCGVDPGTPM